ncbi:MAG: hypothetical protein P4N60_01255 [Verrucomicrobiae bacterium]|nr:hypothetical protein [Verrucomicrobiae bacterium]
MKGEEKIPRWVLHAIEQHLGDCEFRLRRQSKNPETTSAYFLRENAKQLLWLRELVRAHGKIKTEFWYDLPPYAAKKPKNIKLQLGIVDSDA